MGRGHWWSADFDTTRSVTEVRILNRRDCCGERLGGSTVYIDDVLCGTIPGSTSTASTYTVTCTTPLSGSSITIRQNTTYTALQLANVEVWGDNNCHHDEFTNADGARRCSTSSDCTGARTCSKWQWCVGDSGCTPASPTPWLVE